MATNDKDEILTIDQSVGLLKVSSRTVYNLVSKKRTPGRIFAKKVGWSWRIRREEIDRYLPEESSDYQQLPLRSEGVKKSS